MSSSNLALRKNVVETLSLLVERYPNLRIGQIIGNAVMPDSLNFIDDVELARGLNQLFVSYTQFEAAGIMNAAPMTNRLARNADNDQSTPQRGPNE